MTITIWNWPDQPSRYCLLSSKEDGVLILNEATLYNSCFKPEPQKLFMTCLYLPKQEAVCSAALPSY